MKPEKNQNGDSEGLKPERIQKEGTVQRPPAMANARFVTGWVSAVLDWIETAPKSVRDLFGSRDHDSNDNDN